MKTNILTLSFRKVAATDESPAHLVTELRVDGERLGEGCVVDIRRLADALTREGEHFVFTCGCGVPMCLGIVALKTGVGRKLVYDAASMTVTNIPDANQYLTRNYRKGWEV